MEQLELSPEETDSLVKAIVQQRQLRGHSPRVEQEMSRFIRSIGETEAGERSRDALNLEASIRGLGDLRLWDRVKKKLQEDR